jgi:hypothetical protein
VAGRPGEQPGQIFVLYLIPAPLNLPYSAGSHFFMMAKMNHDKIKAKALILLFLLD